ncbi:MAG: S8 family serine peptidase [Anaerolineae bacterium]|nr:S8 family serine peptidase [Anaerolineae bacterium]
MGFDGTGQTIAIVDNGIDEAHPFLASKIIQSAEACFAVGGLCPNGTGQQIGTGAAAHLAGAYHGSHVAGIAAGHRPDTGSPQNGVAKGATIIPINVFGGSTSTNYDDVVKALEYVHQNRQAYSIAAVNMSLGSRFSYNTGYCDDDMSNMARAIESLRAANIATVIASGNDADRNPNGDPFTNGIAFPACISSAISVGSVDKADHISGFSQTANTLSLLAPGESINSSVPTSHAPSGYALDSGTSMAAPHVAGAWAVMKQKMPYATVDQILSLLQTTGKSIADARNSGAIAKRIQLDDAINVRPNTADCAVDLLIRRVSVTADCQQANDASANAVISANGRYVAFESAASNIVAGDTNNVRDIFVRDLQTNLTTRVSVATNGAQANGESVGASLSADGRYVTFLSTATNLADFDFNGAGDVFVHDMLTGQTNCVSVNLLGIPGNGGSSYATISGDGHFVAFNSSASDLISPPDMNSQRDIYVRNLWTGQTKLVSVAYDGGLANYLSEYVTISADGRYIAFESSASNIVSGDTNNAADVFLRDTIAEQTVRVSVASDGSQGNSYSGGGLHQNSISADGRFIAFPSAASNLVSGDTNGATDIFLHDAVTGATERISVASDGSQGNSDSVTPFLTQDGHYVAFESAANNLVSGDTNNYFDIFVHDRQTGKTIRVSTAANGTQGNERSRDASISGDGRYVEFQSLASNLINGDTNFVYDIFVADIAAFVFPTPSPTPTASATASPTPTSTATLTASPTASATVTATRTLTATPTATATNSVPYPDTIGIFRQSNATFYMRNSNTTGFADSSITFGASTDFPITGDWNGDGIDTVGVYRPTTGQFFLTDSTANPAVLHYAFVLGSPGDQPIVGDWDGNGTDGVGVFRPSNGLIYLKNNLTTGFADFTMVLGIPGDVGIAGDWNGDGKDSPGVYRPSNQQFYLTNSICNCSVFADAQLGLGIAGDTPFVGDWDGDGRSGIGVYRQSNGLTYIKNALTTGFADASFVFGSASDYPLAGYWVRVGSPSGVEPAPTFVPAK